MSNPTWHSVFEKAFYFVYCLLMNKTQQQMDVAVNKITAKIDNVEENDTNNNDSVLDISDTTDDDNQEFQQGGH